MAQLIELKDLIPILDAIGFEKDSLPLHLRGHVNSLGLYVRKRAAGELVRLQAGGKFRSYFDAWQRWSVEADFATYEGDVSSWDVRRFDKETWAHRFAHLAEPTWEIAKYVAGIRFSADGEGDGAYHVEFDLQSEDKLGQAIDRFTETGEWLPLLPRVCTKCNEPVSFWRWFWAKRCPRCEQSIRELT